MIKIDWYNPERSILLLEYIEPITWKEYDDANTQAGQMIRGVQHQVYVIHNAGRARMPGGGSALHHLRKAMDDLNIPNCALIFAVVDNTFARSMMNAILRIFTSMPIRMVKSLPDALEAIASAQQAQRDSLVDSA